MLLLLGALSAASALLKNGRSRAMLKEKAEALREYHLGDGTVEEKFITMDVDHINNHGEGTSQTYQMRYLIDQSNSNDVVNPPILFYCGNEGDVFNFYNNSGFMTDTLAKKYKGVVLFGEHRFYGKSMPFGNQSFENNNFKYLTVD